MKFAIDAIWEREILFHSCEVSKTRTMTCILYVFMAWKSKTELFSPAFGSAITLVEIPSHVNATFCYAVVKHNQEILCKSFNPFTVWIHLLHEFKIIRALISFENIPEVQLERKTLSCTLNIVATLQIAVLRELHIPNANRPNLLLLKLSTPSG